jgi:hypothetical protein
MLFVSGPPRLQRDRGVPGRTICSPAEKVGFCLFLNVQEYRRLVRLAAAFGAPIASSSSSGRGIGGSEENPMANLQFAICNLQFAMSFIRNPNPSLSGRRVGGSGGNPMANCKLQIGDELLSGLPAFALVGRAAFPRPNPNKPPHLSPGGGLLQDRGLLMNLHTLVFLWLNSLPLWEILPCVSSSPAGRGWWAAG